MRSLFALLLVVASPALAQRDDQVEAYRAMREGRIRPLGDILSRIPPDRRRAFIGSEFAPGGDRYRLKFMDRGAVTAVDVDARTGAVMNGRAPRASDQGRVETFDERRGYDDRHGYDDGRARRFDGERARAFDEQRARAYDDSRERGFDERRDRGFEDRRERGFDDRRERGMDDRRSPAFENRRDRDPGDRRARFRRNYARPDR